MSKNRKEDQTQKQSHMVPLCTQNSFHVWALLASALFMIRSIEVDSVVSEIVTSLE